MIDCCHTRTRQYWTMYLKLYYLQHIYHKGLYQNLSLQVWLRRSYNTIIQTQCNHKSPWALLDTKPSFRFHISHVAYTMGWPAIWFQKNLLWYPLRSYYTLTYLHEGIHPELQKHLICALHVHQLLVWRIVSTKTLWETRHSLLTWHTFFCLMPYEQVLYLIFPHLFYFIRLTASSTLLFYLKYNLSGSMGVTTGFLSIPPLYICLYYFTITATAFYPNLLIRDFEYICVHMTFVATFINEYVSSFEYWSLINNCFPDLYVFP